MFYLTGTLYPLVARATYPTLGFPQYAGEVGTSEADDAMKAKAQQDAEDAIAAPLDAYRAFFLDGRTFIGGDSPSIADIRLAATLEFLRAIDYDFPAWADGVHGRGRGGSGRRVLGARGRRAGVRRADEGLAAPLDAGDHLARDQLDLPRARRPTATGRRARIPPRRTRREARRSAPPGRCRAGLAARRDLVQHRREHVAQDAILIDAILGDPGPHRGERIGEALRVPPTVLELARQALPCFREADRRRVVGGGEPAVSGTRDPAQPGARAPAADPQRDAARRSRRRAPAGLALEQRSQRRDRLVEALPALLERDARRRRSRAWTNRVQGQRSAGLRRGHRGPPAPLPAAPAPAGRRARPSWPAPCPPSARSCSRARSARRARASRRRSGRWRRPPRTRSRERRQPPA